VNALSRNGQVKLTGCLLLSGICFRRSCGASCCPAAEPGAGAKPGWEGETGGWREARLRRRNRGL